MAKPLQFVRFLAKWVAVGVAATAVAVGAFVAWDPVLAARLGSYPFEAPVADLSWYETTEDVPGGDGEELEVVDPADVGLDAAELERAADWAEDRASCALIVARRGRIALERYWELGGPDVRTQSYSLAKTVLGLLVGLAVEDGTLAGLDEPAATYLTEWAGDGRAAITIDHLLRMLSGLEYDDERWNPFSDMVRTHLGGDLTPVVLGMPLLAAPGRRFEYTNLGSQALGLALLRASGRRYAELLSERLWRPLGAGDARVWLDREGGVAKTYCCLFATARDWLRVGELMRRGGRVGERQVVPASWIAAMIEPADPHPGYGRHVWLHPGVELQEDEGGGTLTWFWLDGKDKQRVYVIPSLEAVVVRLGQHPPEGRRWDETWLPRAVARAAVALGD